MSERLPDALKHFCEKLRATVEGGNEIAIISHLNADGITSGSIMAKAFRRMGARYSVRTISGMSGSLIQKMKDDGRDFYVITDLGAGWAPVLKKALGDKWLIIDHHYVSKQEISTDDDDQILNPWKFDIDGEKEISAGGMAFLVARTLEPKNRDLSAIAVVSAVAERQDLGDKKSFIGQNTEILKTAQSLGLVSVDLDIVLTGRETRPLHEAIAYTLCPYIDGLTWNKEACYLLIKNTGIQLKDNRGHWRVPAELSQEEKSEMVEAIAKFVANSDNNRLSDIMRDDLVGYVYTLTREDKRSQLRDAREFSTLLDACGREKNSGVGIAICMGDRNAALTAGEEILSSYKISLKRVLSTIFSEKWRLSDDGKTTFINGDGILEEEFLGEVSTILSGSPYLRGKILFVRTLTKDGLYKFSSRKCRDCKSQVNLGAILQECTKALNGEGQGYSEAATCNIPSPALEDFIFNVRAETSGAKVSTSSS
ncbi:MAG TPA: DHH family phosphoesterase [Nitrososphaera sp.]|nr:DHH family phosphoesterase [Nitrososphaera sp.]